MVQLPTVEEIEKPAPAPAPGMAALTAGLLASGLAFGAIVLGLQVVVFLMLVVLGPFVSALVGAAAAVEVQRAILFLVVNWRPPRARLALTGVIAAVPVAVVASAASSSAISTIVTLTIPALVLQAALLAYLSD